MINRRAFCAASIGSLVFTGKSSIAENYKLDYKTATNLDAEALAEFGIRDAYEELIPIIKENDVQLAPITEHISPEMDSYSVSTATRQYRIFDPATFKTALVDELWAAAAAEFFRLINDQLEHTSVRFYALNGGNDLMGIVLTPGEAETARKTIRSPEDWPYTPERTGPWYGQYSSGAREIPWWVSVTRQLK